MENKNTKRDKNIKTEIRKTYIKYLNREPDERGSASYYKKIKNGMTIPQFIQQIKNSNEYKITQHQFNTQPTNSKQTPVHTHTHTYTHKVEYITPESKKHLNSTTQIMKNAPQTLTTRLDVVRPMLTEHDLMLFDKYLDDPTNTIKKYFEFGSGNSTLYTANKSTVAKVYSVENDRQWYQRIINTHNKKIEIQYTNTNSSLNSYGKPTKIDKQKFAKYYQSYKVSHNCNIIMIDGRFRVSCALDMFDKINENVIVLFDDFNNRMNKYGVVLKYYEVIEKGDRIIILRRKRNDDIDRNELNKDKVIYATNAD